MRVAYLRTTDGDAGEPAPADERGGRRRRGAGDQRAACRSSARRPTPHDSVVAQIMKIPGAGNGSPTDADWQKVGELCLGPTKANVQPGEFKGVDFSFMGLNNQNLHNFLFRGFLKPWEAYTGASIKWIDLAQADYNARLQQSIATGTVDFDIIEMGAPFEGDMGVKDLLSDMPDWVMKQIDFDDYRQLPQAAGRHLERQDPSRHHRQRLPHDEHPHRRLRRSRSRQGLEGRRQRGRRGARRRPGSRCSRSPSSSRARSSRARTSTASSTSRSRGAASSSISPCSRATAYAKYPGEKNWLFDENMKPLVNNPAWVRAIQDVVDCAALRAGRPDQRRSRHDRLPAVPGRHRFAARVVGRHRHGRQDQRHRDDRRRARLRHPARFGRRLQLPEGAVGEARRAGRTSRRTWPISAGASM